MSLEKFIRLYYHHIATIMKFSRKKKKPSLEILLKIWPAPRITSWNFCKNIERSFDGVTWKIEMSLLSASMLQFSEAVTSKMELFVKKVNGFYLRWDIVPDPPLVLMKSFEKFNCS